MLFRSQGDAVIQKIKDIYELANENKNKLCTDTRKRNRVLNGCKNILKKGTKKEEYSAFIATIIKDDENYQKLKYMLIELELWNDELQNLDNEVEKIKMQTRPDEN